MTRSRKPHRRPAAAWSRASLFAIVVAVCVACGVFDARASEPSRAPFAGTTTPSARHVMPLDATPLFEATRDA